MSIIIPHDIFPYIPHVSTIEMVLEMVLKNHQVLMMDLDMLVRGNLDELFQLRRLLRQGEAGGFSYEKIWVYKFHHDRTLFSRALEIMKLDCGESSPKPQDSG